MPTKKRIFHLIKGLGRGGAEILLADGLRLANRSRFEYGYGYFLPWKDAMVESLYVQGADVRCFEAHSNLAVLLSVPRVAHHLKQWEADLVHCHLPLSAVVGRLAGRITGTPVVYTEHNEWEHHSFLTRTLNRLTWPLQSAAVAVSPRVLDSIETYLGPDNALRVVLNGIDVDRFSPTRFDGPEVRAQIDIPGDAFVVGTVAIFTDQKKLDDWLHAAKRILDRIPETHFLIVGDGPLRSSLEDLASQLNIREKVHFAGLQENIPPYLAAMDVYLMSSRNEGLGLALVEAMSMEVPVVSTNAGGIKNVVEHDVNGLLVRVGDVAGMANKVSDLFRDQQHRSRLVRAARETALQRFSMRRMVSELESLYLEVIDASP